MNTTQLAEQITAALPAGQFAKAWSGKHQDRIYIREGKRELCHYEIYAQKGIAIRNGRNFGMFDPARNFRTGSDEDFGATQIIAAGYILQKGE